jgi:hypothetical protein
MANHVGFGTTTAHITITVPLHLIINEGSFPSSNHTRRTVASFYVPSLLKSGETQNKTLLTLQSSKKASPDSFDLIV